MHAPCVASPPALTLSFIGVAIGLALSVPVFRLLAAGLTGLGPLNAWTQALVPTGLILVTLLACWAPARRATRISPTIALRQD